MLRETDASITIGIIFLYDNLVNDSIFSSVSNLQE